MHFAADTVAAIFPHNGVSVLPGKTDVSKMCARSNYSDACPHCLAGNLYTETPIILVTGDGYRAELLAFISGTVTGVTVTNGGSGYSSAPVVTIAPQRR